MPIISQMSILFFFAILTEFEDVTEHMGPEDNFCYKEKISNDSVYSQVVGFDVRISNM